MSCPNKNMPEWKNLVAALGGEGEALAAFTLNQYEIPTVDEADIILEQWRSGKFAENAEWSIALKGETFIQPAIAVEKIDPVFIAANHTQFTVP